MGYTHLLWAVIGGGLGGLLGVYVAARITQAQWRAAAIGACVITLALVTPLVMRSIFSRPATVPPLVKGGAKLQAHPGFRKAVAGMSTDQVQKFTQKHALQGLKRLPFHQLKRWNSLRLKMVTISPALCAGFWTGRGMTGALVQTALTKMAPAEVEEWFELSIDAALLDIDQVAFPPVSAEAMQNGIASIARKMRKSETQRIQLTMLAADKAKDADACWVMKAFLSGAESLPLNQQEQFIRALASI